MTVWRNLGSLLAGLALLGLSACNSSNGTAPGVSDGLAVDPYLVGATFFEDLDNNGLRDEGEQLSGPSGSDGAFSFEAPLTVGSTLVMVTAGTHQGLPYSVTLRRAITAGDESPLVVSPLTTLLSSGLSPAELLQLFTDAGMPGAADLQAAQLSADPMAGLETLTAANVTAADLALLRANFVAYGILEYLGILELGPLDAARIEQVLLNSGAFSATLFDAIAYLCSPQRLAAVEATLPAGLPAMTMADLADAVPAILYWWTNRFYADLVSGQENFPVFAEMATQLDSFSAALTPCFYALNRLDDPAVDPADFLDPGLLPLSADTFVMLENLPDPVTVRPVAEEIRLTPAHFEDVAYVLMDTVLRFGADGSFEQFAPGLAGTTGSWSLAGNDLLVTEDGTTESVTLSLVGEWPTYLRLKPTGMDSTTGSPPANLPFSKLLPLTPNDLAGTSLILDDGTCAAALCGGWLEFGAYDSQQGYGLATLRTYPDGTTPETVNWWLEADGAVAVLTTDNLKTELFPHTERGDVVVASWDNNTGTLLEVSAEFAYRPDTPASIDSGLFDLTGSLATSLALAGDGTFRVDDGGTVTVGFWSYSAATGEVSFTVGGEVVGRLWFYNASGIDAPLPVFYELYEAGTLVESGFDIMTYAGPASLNDLAFNQTITAHTNTAQGAPENVVDADLATSWYSWQGLTSSCSFTLDLGAATTIGSLTMRLLQTDSYQIETSLDDTNWTLQHSAGNLWSRGTSIDESVNLPSPVSARYLRYTGQNSENAWVGLSDFRVFAASP